MANIKSRSLLSAKGVHALFDNVPPRIRRASALLIALLLICLFLFQVGFIYKITGDSNTGSISLSMDQMDSWTIYMSQLSADDSEVFALRWFAKYENNHSRVYASQEGIGYLMSYGSVPRQRLNVLENETSTYWGSISYIFFDRLNLDDDVFVGGSVWSSTDFSHLINETDQIYSNGHSIFHCGHNVGSGP